jgi:hypothetical protein
MHILKIILLSLVGVGVAAFNRIGSSKDGWEG